MIAEILLMMQLAPAVGDFQFERADVPVGNVYHYRKSNIDGTSASNVMLYIATADRIESLKWTDGRDAASLVTADIDWERFSAGAMRNWRLRPDAEPELRGRLDAGPDASAYRYAFGPIKGETSLSEFPWHSYDFDFSSLNVTLRFLTDPTAGFSFHVADAIPEGDSWVFGPVGKVNARYVGEARRHGEACNVYAVDGPGLDNRGGSIWVSRAGGHIVDLEIDLPDEDKYRNNKLQLLSVDKVSAEDWQRTVRTVWRVAAGSQDRDAASRALTETPAGR